MLQDIPTPTLREASSCVLETERLMLRKPTLADVKAIAGQAAAKSRAAAQDGRNCRKVMRSAGRMTKSEMIPSRN